MRLAPAALALLTVPALAQTVELRLEDYGTGFGYSAAMDGALAVIGSSYPSLEVNHFPIGNATILREQGGRWSIEQILAPANAGLSYGCAVDTDGERVVVGDLDSSVVVYARRGDAWEVEAEIPGYVCSGGVAIDGRWLAFYDNGTPKQIAIYERVGSTWEPRAPIPLDDSVSDMELQGDLLAVGITGSPTILGVIRPVPGRVVVYRALQGRWERDQVLESSKIDDPHFGSDLALRGEWLAVADYDDTVSFFRRSAGAFELAQELPLDRTRRIALGDVHGVVTWGEAPFRHHALNLEDGRWRLGRQIATGSGYQNRFSVAASGDEAWIGFSDSTGEAFVVPTTPAALFVTPPEGPAREIHFEAVGGESGDPAAVRLVAVDGDEVPAAWLTQGAIGDSGNWKSRHEIPAELVGHTLSFEAIVVTAEGPIVSNRDTYRVSVGFPPVAKRSPRTNPQTRAWLPTTFESPLSYGIDGATIVDWKWTFSDGASLSGPRVQHTFTSARPHFVTLTVRDSNGAKDSKSWEVYAQEPDACDIRTSGRPVLGDVLRFDGTLSAKPGTTVRAYRWELGDGTTASGAIAHHAYTDLGTYDVSLEIEYDDGTTSSCQTTVTLDANQLPRCSLQVPSSVRVGEVFELWTNDSIDPDGFIVNESLMISTHAGVWVLSKPYSPYVPYYSVMFSEDLGSYQAQLRLTDDDGAVVSCVETFTVEPNPCLIRFPSAHLKAGSLLTLDGSQSEKLGRAVVAHAWDFGDGSTGFGPTPTHVYEQAGTFDLSLEVTYSDGSIESCVLPIPIQP